jgi:hypothetical protein
LEFCEEDSSSFGAICYCANLKYDANNAMPMPIIDWELQFTIYDSMGGSYVENLQVLMRLNVC